MIVATLLQPFESIPVSLIAGVRVLYFTIDVTLSSVDVLQMFDKKSYSPAFESLVPSVISRLTFLDFFLDIFPLLLYHNNMRIASLHSLFTHIIITFFNNHHHHVYYFYLEINKAFFHYCKMHE